MTVNIDYEVRLAQDGDSAGLDAFLQSEGWHVSADDLMTNGRAREIFVARAVSTGEFVGMLVGKIACDETSWPEPLQPVCRIFDLLTSSTFQRQGIGTALLARFVADAASAERRSLVLAVDVREPIQGRVAFFEACGLHWLDEERSLMGADLALVRQTLNARHLSHKLGCQTRRSD